MKGSPPAAVATIGVFDGVHLGHQALITRVVERAAQLGVESACVTFFPHPEDVLRPQTEIPHLASLEDRLELIRRLGITHVVVLEFTPELARRSPEEFVQLLQQRFDLRELWIGSDFALGRGRSGGPDLLSALGQAHGFGVCQFPPRKVQGVVASSTLIRLQLAEGQVEAAARLLGRCYRLRGRVVAGDHRGTSLGFATANLAVGERLCVPADGVYAVRAGTVAWEGHPGVANLGVRPTFGGAGRQIEIHLFDFEGNLYGQEMAVDFVARLRGERRFDSAAELVAQIQEDAARARALLS